MHHTMTQMLVPRLEEGGNPSDNVGGHYIEMTAEVVLQGEVTQ